MNAFDAYVAALARELPRARRRMVARELRADLDAELEAAMRADPAADPEDVMGRIVAGRQDPRDLARDIAPPAGALVGGHAYPVYRTVLVLALCISVGLVIVLSLALDEWTGANAWARLSGIGTAALIVFCFVTLAFAAMDRLGVNFAAAGGVLSSRPPRRAAVGFSTATLCVSVATSLAVAFPAWVALPLLVDEPEWRVLLFPVLSPALRGTAQWLVGTWSLGVLVAWTLQRAGVLRPAGLAALALAVRAFGLLASLWILWTTPVFALPANDALQAIPGDLRTAMVEAIAPMLFGLLRAALWLALLLHAVRFARSDLATVRLARRGG